jgi:hypothetical protein
VTEACSASSQPGEDSNEHVPESGKSGLRKEWGRSGRQPFPFNRIPKLLLIHLEFNCVKLLNLSKSISVFESETIMSGETLDQNEHSSLPDWAALQVHEENTRNVTTHQGAPRVYGRLGFCELRLNERIVWRGWDAIQCKPTDRVNKSGKDCGGSLSLLTGRSPHR